MVDRHLDDGGRVHQFAEVEQPGDVVVLDQDVELVAGVVDTQSTCDVHRHCKPSKDYDTRL